MTDLLPVGVHPGDQRSLTPLEGSEPVPHDAGGLRANRGKGPWSVNNSRALGVFQRLGSTWNVDTVILSAQTPVAKISGPRPGRTNLTLWVPSSYFPGGVLTTTPAGVLFGPDDGELQQFIGGVPLFVGDSASVESEGTVWVGLQPGLTSGVVCWAHAWEDLLGES